MKNKTIKQMFLAAGVAMAMGTVSAAPVHGLPSGMFEANGASFDENGVGSLAITNINDILAAVNTTSGSDIDNTKFWQSFVEDTKTETFNYTGAAPLIQELVYTVLGEAKNAAGWNAGAASGMENLTSNISRVYSQSELEQQAGFKVGDDDGTGVLYTLADLEANTGLSTTVESKGNYTNGNIKVTGENAIKLLAALNFEDRNGNVVSHSNFGAVNCANPDDSALTGCATSQANNDANVLNTDVTLQNDISTSVSTTTTSVSADVIANGGNTFKGLVAAAELNETAFINANVLIRDIAAKLENGYILDVAAATNAVTQVIGQHNAFLGASIVDTAHSIKDTIKIMGLQVAAAEVGKVAGTSCTGTGQSIIGKACVAIGSKFKDILTDIGSIDNAKVVSDYNDALAVIDGFADDLITFNASNLAGGYVAGDKFSAIQGQFGTVTVTIDEDSDDATDTFYESLVRGDLDNGDGTGNPITSANWTIDVDGDLDFEFEDFNGTIDINGDNAELH